MSRYVRSRCPPTSATSMSTRSEEHTSELQSRSDLVCRLLLEKKKMTRRVADHCFSDLRPLAHADQGSARVERVRGQRFVARGIYRCACEHGACFFFFNDTATTEIYTLSLHDALPI